MSVTSKPINPSQNSMHWVYAAFGAVFVAVGWFCHPKVQAELQQGNWAVGLVYGFGLIGLFLLYRAYASYIDLRRFGAAGLKLSPEAGQLGGELGGEFEFEKPLTELNYKLEVQCYEVTRNTSGKHTSIQRKLKWKEVHVPELIPAHPGMRLGFVLPLPATLPESKPVSSSAGTEWSLILTGQSKDATTVFERHYTIPVERGSAKSSFVHRPEHLQAAKLKLEQESLQILSSLYGLEPGSSVLNLKTPAFHNMAVNLTLCLVGAVFFVPVGFMLHEFVNKEFGVFSLVLGFMSFVFGMVALLLTSMGLARLLTGVHTRVEHGTLSVRRSFMGVGLATKQLSQSELTAITIKNSSTTHGASGSSKQYFDVSAKLGTGKSLVLTRGVPGKPAANTLKQLLTNALNLETKSEL